MPGHLTMDTESNIRINRLGEPGHAIDRTRQSLNFASDCVFTTPRHFVNCFLSGEE